MDDTIYRQAAIDAFLTELTKRERKNLLHTWSTVEVKYFITDMLERLPSAQPEIIRCKECEWFRKEYGWNCIEYTVCGVSPTHHPIRREDDFCSHAERRSDE